MKVYKGLNSKTKGTYYNEDGLLFKDGKLTDIGKKLFGKDAQRTEWNMRNGKPYIKAETTNYYKKGGVLKAANGLTYKQLFDQARANKNNLFWYKRENG